MRWSDDPLERAFEYRLTPVDPTDLDALLTDETWEAVDSLVSRARSYGRNPNFIDASVTALVEPALRTLTEAGFAIITARVAVHVILADMCERRIPYWRWDDACWARTITHGADAQRSGRHKAARCKLLLITLACHHASFRAVETIGRFGQYRLTATIFDRAAVDRSVDTVMNRMTELGFGTMRKASGNVEALCLAFVIQGSTCLADLTTETLALVMQYEAEFVRRGAAGVSRILAADNVIGERLWHRPLGVRVRWDRIGYDPTDGIAPDWLRMSRTWAELDLGAETTTRSAYQGLLKCGRWLAAAHPDITSPEQWTYKTAQSFVVAVLDMKVGDWVHAIGTNLPREGESLRPATMARLIVFLRNFFQLLQDAGEIRRRFDPKVAFAIPRRLSAKINPDPRPIAEDVWIRLVTAGETLMEADLPNSGGGTLVPRYPLPMWRALAAVWLFAGLRTGETNRLLLDCIEWDSDGAARICWLHVPPNKGGAGGRKPVDPHVGVMIEAWQRARVSQPPVYDDLIGSEVDYLFAHRGRRVGAGFVRDSLIPLLCHKGDVPSADAMGPIVPSRARSTIITQLYHSENGMSEAQLSQWALHKSSRSIKHYIGGRPVRLARALERARARETALSVRSLMDQRQGENGSDFAIDMGHGTCGNDRFASCPHFTACHKCAFYTPDTDALPSLVRALRALQKRVEGQGLTVSERETVATSIKAIWPCPTEWCS